MKLNISTRIKVFGIAVILIVAGQIIFTIKNVNSFQNSYVETLRAKCQKLGEFLKNDVEYVLNLNIPLDKLVRIEQTLKDILSASPELDCIEISDLDGRVLYHADHSSMRTAADSETSSSQPGLEVSAEGLKPSGFSQNQMDTRLPVFLQKESRQVGNILLRLSATPIVAKSREILMDMITVILTSLLITFEFLSLFVAFSISSPLEKVVGDMEKAIINLKPLFSRGFLLMPELHHIVSRFDYFLETYLSHIRPFIAAQRWFEKTTRMILPHITRHLHKLDAALLSCRASTSNGVSHKTLQQSLEDLKSGFSDLHVRLLSLSSRLSLSAFDPLKDQQTAKQDVSVKRIPYIYIRPLIFLIVMSDSFSTSFFPLYVNTLYNPAWHISREIVLGVPISAYMLLFAISILFAGNWSDKVGWYKPLIAGGLLNAIGLVTTPLCLDFYQLVMVRALAATGFGLFFMGCQRFVIDNTSAENRSPGMAAFAAAYFSGSICGTVIGGMLADRIGFGNVFYVSGSVSVLALYFVIILFQRNEMPLGQVIRERSGFSEILHVIKDREFSAIVFLQAIPAKIILVGYLIYFVPLYLKKIGTLQSSIGRVVMCYGLAMVFLGPIFSNYFDRLAYRKYHLFAGGVISGLSMIAYYFYSGFGPTLFVVVMLGVSHSLSVSSQAALISETDTVKNAGAGTGMGVFRFWERLGNVLGPIVMGFLIARAGYESSAVALGIFSVVCSILYLLFSFCRQKKSR
ncbi:MAG: MFS transporter [Deltaproteobacteria bacterium]|nr:MFS transporter [Deltaproteobacteria bacterium]